MPRLPVRPPSLVVPDLHLRILYEGVDLNGRTITVSGDPKALKLSEFQIKNGADRATGTISLRLYFSKSVVSTIPFNPNYPWQPTTSDENGFPTAFYASGVAVVNPTETWNWPAFVGSLTEDLDEVSARLKIFYGAAHPAEANFVIRRKK